MMLLAITSPQGGTIIAQDVSPGSANLAHPSPPGTAQDHPTPRATGAASEAARVLNGPLPRAPALG